MKLAWLAVMVGAMTAMGCSMASEAATDGVDAVSETRSSTLHGTWTDDRGVARPAEVTIEQEALSARLVMRLEGHVCLSESVVEVKATLDGVKTTADVAGMHLDIDGKPDLDTLKANFAAIEAGPCPGQGGWMTVAR